MKYFHSLYIFLFFFSFFGLSSPPILSVAVVLPEGGQVPSGTKRALISFKFQSQLKKKKSSKRVEPLRKWKSYFFFNARKRKKRRKSQKKTPFFSHIKSKDGEFVYKSQVEGMWEEEAAGRLVRGAAPPRPRQGKKGVLASPEAMTLGCGDAEFSWVWCVKTVRKNGRKRNYAESQYTGLFLFPGQDGEGWRPPQGNAPTTRPVPGPCYSKCGTGKVLAFNPLRHKLWNGE